MKKIKGIGLKLDLGCGAFTKEGFIGLDSLPNGSNPFGVEYTKTDVVCNLNEGIPAKDSTVNEIYCGHFFEHVDNLTEFINEIYRVCSNDAKIEIVVPIFEYFSPDHKTVLFPGWSSRYFAVPRFNIDKIETREKNVTTASGVKYDIFEQSIFISVIKHLIKK